MFRETRLPRRSFRPAKDASSSSYSSICHYSSPYCWILLFALIYCLGFILLLPSSTNYYSSSTNFFYNNHQYHNHDYDHPYHQHSYYEVKDVNSNNQNQNSNQDKNQIQNANPKQKQKQNNVNQNQNPNKKQSFYYADEDPATNPLIITDYHDNSHPARYLDWNQSLPINAPQVAGKYLPLNRPWGYIYSHRVLCLIITLWPTRKYKMELISQTYAPGCTKLMFVVDKASNPPSKIFGYETMIIELSRIQGVEMKHRNIWEKVHRMWSKVYNTPSLLSNFDWFIKADDDAFIVTSNLHGFVQYLDPDFPHYLGHSIRSRWKVENVVFNSGICYVLSRATIERIGPYEHQLPTLGTSPGRSHCIDRDGAGEDPTTGICLLGVGIRPTNTLDHQMRERFLIFRDTDHHKIFREDTWYWKYKPSSVKQGRECCSPYLISVHNYKSDADALKFFPLLQAQYNQVKDWSLIELPPRPRWFLYDSQALDFEIDEWCNVKDPPRGQRIYKGPVDGEWICWKCKIGDENDPYWTEWWDGKQALPSQHVNDVYSPIKIVAYT